MKDHQIIKVDSAFPDYPAEKLQEALNDGWVIIDKTVTDDRYITYILAKEPRDPDLGKAYPQPPN